MPKGEYTRTEAGRRAYFVVTGVEFMMRSKHIRMCCHKICGGATMSPISIL